MFGRKAEKIEQLKKEVNRLQGIVRDDDDIIRKLHENEIVMLSTITTKNTEISGLHAELENAQHEIDKLHQAITDLTYERDEVTERLNKGFEMINKATELTEQVTLLIKKISPAPKRKR